MPDNKKVIYADDLMAEVKRTAEIMKRRREQFSLRNLLMCIKNAPAVEVPKTPCDLCRYNPPSSFSDKPCTICVAERRM
jgi:hypothetical protein